MPPRKTTTQTTAKTTRPKAKATEVDARPDPRPDPAGPTPSADPEPAATPIPSRAFAALGLSEPWMLAWAESALATGSAEDACADAQVSLADFADARKRDPVFDDLGRTLDQITDLRITEKLRADAIRGDIRAQTLYYARVRDLVLPEPPLSAETMLTATIAEAMLSAGLDAASG